MRASFVLVLMILVVGCVETDIPERVDHTRDIEYDTENFTKPQVPQIDPPGNLALPFRIEDLNPNGLISPFGINRHSRDSGHGHGGIDIPLKSDSPVLAVQTGSIIAIRNGSGGRGGFDVDLLIIGTGGEGWGFTYEHIDLHEDVGLNTYVGQGQIIGTNALIDKNGNTHLHLSYMFNGFEYTRDHRCWVDFLREDDRDELLEYFESKKSKISSDWSSVKEEGMNPYIGVLDSEKYPDGPSLCYPLGLDVRIPVQ